MHPVSSSPRPTAGGDGLPAPVSRFTPVHLPLSYDHRLSDGADAARYLTEVTAILGTAAFAGDLFPGTDPEAPVRSRGSGAVDLCRTGRRWAVPSPSVSSRTHSG